MLAPVFNNDGKVLTRESTQLLGSIRASERNPEDRCECVVPICRKEDWFSGEDHTGITLLSIADELPAGIIFKDYEAHSGNRYDVLDDITSFRGPNQNVYSVHHFPGLHPCYLIFDRNKNLPSVKQSVFNFVTTYLSLAPS